jgi:hypothetical protein
MRSRRIAAVTATFLLGTCTVARAVTIADLVAAPGSYNGHVVTLSGTVAVAVPVGTESGYDLRDAGAKISIVSRSGPPITGQALTVTGTVRAVADDEASGGFLPPFLVETSRTPGP